MKQFLNRVLGYVFGLPIIVLASPLLLVYWLSPTLDQKAWRALRRGDLKKAQSLANQALNEAQRKARDWNYGNVIHDANQILGIVALRRGDVKRAKRLLVLAGKTPGSPQLNTGGIHLVLARELAQCGESGTVLEYLHSIRRFFLDRPSPDSAGTGIWGFGGLWKKLAALEREDSRQLFESWQKEIESGRVPQHRLWR